MKVSKSESRTVKEASGSTAADRVSSRTNLISNVGEYDRGYSPDVTISAEGRSGMERGRFIEDGRKVKNKEVQEFRTQKRGTVVSKQPIRSTSTISVMYTT